jgi:predicted CoA-substrate-specific enzyme activase
MDICNIFTVDKVARIPQNPVVGIDIGSSQSKAALLANGEIYTSLAATGLFMKTTAQELLEDLFTQSGLGIADLDYIVATGYGRIALDFGDIPSRMVTEISCHGLGASYLGQDIHTIIDIGGQDSKVIRINPEDGKVLDFVMNDKCAAGTGRFLEKVANILEYDITDLGALSLEAVKPAEISSQCVVFAESEIISDRAKGEKVQNLAAGVHISVAKRVNNLLNRVGIVPNVFFSGGVANNIGMKKILEDFLGFPVVSSPLDTVFTGAIGSALFAGQYAHKHSKQPEHMNEDQFAIDLTNLNNSVDRQQEDYTRRRTGKHKNVAYLCTYTPLEILSAANVSHIRMLHAGNQKEVSAGESITQSIFCDFTKSSLGSFHENYPLYAGIDKVYTFYTCDCMRKTAEAIDSHFVPTGIFNMPRLMGNLDSRNYLATELDGFVRDLEKLTKENIDRNKIREYIRRYNRAKELLREIASFRKYTLPPLTSSQFQQIARSYFLLPVEELIPQLEQILVQLKSYRPPRIQERPIRLMIAGGIIADGDTKLTNLIENANAGVRVVMEDNCTGYSPFDRDIAETDDDVLKDLATGYLGQAPCARMKPLSDRIDFSARLAKEYNVDGVIYYFMKFCPCYGIAKNEFVRRFQEMGILVLEIPGDYSTGDEGQLKTRLEAFIEVLKEKELTLD